MLAVGYCESMNEQLQPEDTQELQRPEMSAEALSSPPVLSEDLALAELKNRDLAVGAIDRMAQNNGLMKSRKVRIAMAVHPRTARRTALRLIREFYTFELMRFALTPSAAADLRHIADELLLARVASISLGERISLARTCSEVVAGALLADKETSVWRAALQNPRLTERAIVKALQRTLVTPALVHCVSHHAKWSVRAEIRLALLRNPHTPLARAIEFARRLPTAQLCDILHMSRLPERTKEYLRKVHTSCTGRKLRDGQFLS
jgi:hypothetical protein